MHPAQGARHQDRCRRAAPFGGKRSKTCSVARRASLRAGTAKAEPELAWQEPDVRPRANDSVWSDHNAPCARVAVIRLETRIAFGIQLEPCFGVVFVAVIKREGGIVGWVHGHEPKDLTLPLVLLSF